MLLVCRFRVGGLECADSWKGGAASCTQPHNMRAGQAWTSASQGHCSITRTWPADPAASCGYQGDLVYLGFNQVATAPGSCLTASWVQLAALKKGSYICVKE